MSVLSSPHKALALLALGLFTWSDGPAENHRELDVEFARVGQRAGPVARYTISRTPRTAVAGSLLANVVGARTS